MKAAESLKNNRRIPNCPPAVTMKHSPRRVRGASSVNRHVLRRPSPISSELQDGQPQRPQTRDCLPKEKNDVEHMYRQDVPMKAVMMTKCPRPGCSSGFVQPFRRDLHPCGSPSCLCHCASQEAICSATETIRLNNRIQLGMRSPLH